MPTDEGKPCNRAVSLYLAVMRSPLRIAGTLAALSFSAVGCGRGSTCDALGATSPLLDHAAGLRVDLYGPASEGAHCQGDSIVAGSPAPSQTRTFARGEALRLDLPPGRYTLALTAFSDGTGQVVVARACSDVELGAGAACVLFALVAAMDPPDDAGVSPRDADRGTVLHPPPPTFCPPGLATCPGDVSACSSTLETVDHCGDCDVGCDLESALGASCDGARCSYTGCVAGRADCDGAGGANANANGCECDTPSCCGTGCQLRHPSGLGPTYLSCAPLGDHSEGSAELACASVTGDATECSMVKSGPGRSICSTGAVTCSCWQFVGPATGRVSSSSDSTCVPPTTSDPTWG